MPLMGIRARTRRALSTIRVSPTATPNSSGIRSGLSLSRISRQVRNSPTTTATRSMMSPQNPAIAARIIVVGISWVPRLALPQAASASVMSLPVAWEVERLETLCQCSSYLGGAAPYCRHDSDWCASMQERFRRDLAGGSAPFFPRAASCDPGEWQGAGSTRQQSRPGRRGGCGAHACPRDL